jgi:small multidrug resistance family-3 protein
MPAQRRVVRHRRRAAANEPPRSVAHDDRYDGLFFLTAIAELVGCYLPLLWLSGKGAAWLLIPAALSLAAFVWLLTLHPAASGRAYATYGAVYIAAALGWLWAVDGVKPS